MHVPNVHPSVNWPLVVSALAAVLSTRAIKAQHVRGFRIAWQTDIHGVLLGVVGGSIANVKVRFAGPLSYQRWESIRWLLGTRP